LVACPPLRALATNPCGSRAACIATRRQHGASTFAHRKSGVPVYAHSVGSLGPLCTLWVPGRSRTRPRYRPSSIQTGARRPQRRTQRRRPRRQVRVRPVATRRGACRVLSTRKRQQARISSTTSKRRAK
jgi:hypothetical protein